MSDAQIIVYAHFMYFQIPKPPMENLRASAGLPKIVVVILKGLSRSL